MMLYTDDVKAMLGGISDAQLESTFAAAIASSTEALINSDIDAAFRIVFVGSVRIQYKYSDRSQRIVLEGKIF